MLLQSRQIIKETFALYPNTEDIGQDRVFKGRTVIHMYPFGDTIGKDGTLNGYVHNLFFKMDVYNKKTRYTDPQLHDGIFTIDCEVNNVCIFKDGSTCVSIDGTVQFLNGQAVTFAPKL